MKKDKIITKRVLLSLLKIFFLIFFSCYIFTLINLNLRLNSREETRGKFNYVFGKISFFQNDSAEKKNKIFLLLFLCYFPMKILIDFFINYEKDRLKETMKVNLYKLVAIHCYQNEEIAFKHKKRIEKIFFNIIPDFTNIFFDFFCNFFRFFINICFQIYLLCYFLQQNNSDNETKWIIIEFVLAFLFCYIFYTFAANKIKKDNWKEKTNRQLKERNRVNDFLESPRNLGEILHSFDYNKKQSIYFYLIENISKLANLLIPGVSIGFIFFYHQIISSDFSGNFWTVFLTSMNLQRIFIELRSISLLKFSILKKNKYEIEAIINFFENRRLIN